MEISTATDQEPINSLQLHYRPILAKLSHLLKTNLFTDEEFEQVFKLMPAFEKATAYLKGIIENDPERDSIN